MIQYFSLLVPFIWGTHILVDVYLFMWVWVSAPKWVQGYKHGSMDGISSVLQWGHALNVTPCPSIFFPLLLPFCIQYLIAFPSHTINALNHISFHSDKLPITWQLRCRPSLAFNFRQFCWMVKSKWKLALFTRVVVKMQSKCNTQKCKWTTLSCYPMTWDIWDMVSLVKKKELHASISNQQEDMDHFPLITQLHSCNFVAVLFFQHLGEFWRMKIKLVCDCCV